MQHSQHHSFDKETPTSIHVWGWSGRRRLSTDVTTCDSELCLPLQLPLVINRCRCRWYTSCYFPRALASSFATPFVQVRRILTYRSGRSWPVTYTSKHPLQHTDHPRTDVILVAQIAGRVFVLCSLSTSVLIRMHGPVVTFAHPLQWRSLP